MRRILRRRRCANCSWTMAQIKTPQITMGMRHGIGWRAHRHLVGIWDRRRKSSWLSETEILWHPIPNSFLFLFSAHFFFADIARRLLSTRWVRREESKLWREPKNQYWSFFVI